ncbi:O-antigen polymerase [Leptospira santarosai]|uniref:O-antigen polymerase n=1 Tax=Leptospira santarosai TaxID=28183 RepID=UPI000297CC77|nr:O-antigen polymerase [Leptospira santarosai]EKS07938.1 oligosaccharide repeat unit polymerase [Leptospira santarosai str. JET]
MSVVILGIGILNVSLSYFFLKKTSCILILIHAYWFFWMFLSSLSLTGLFVPSDFTYYLYLLLLSSVTIGVGFFKIYTFAFLESKQDLKCTSIFKIRGQEKEKYFFYFLCFFILPIVSFFFIRSIYLQSNSENMLYSDYRSLAYGLLGDSILFFKNKYLNYYSLIISPILFASLFLGVSFFLRFKRIRVLTLSSIILAMDTLMMLGRFGFYYIIIVLLLVVLIKIFRNRKGIFNIIKFREVILVGGGIVILVFFVGVLRNTKKEFNFKEFVNIYLIDYHTESFTMFDYELKNEKSILHERTYGRASLGGLERGFSFMLGLLRVPFHIQIESDAVATYLHKNRLLGYTSDGKPKEYNAFGSVLFSLYKDGGIPFTIVMGFVFGFLIAKYSKVVISLNAYQLSLLASLLYIGIFGIFKPVLGDEILLTILFLVFFWRL